MNNDKRFAGVLGGGEYDLLKKALWYYDDLEDTVAKQVAQAVSNVDNPKLLEIGIGSGITTAFVLNEIGATKNIEIYAIDNEQKMLDEAEQRFSGIDGLKFIAADIFEYLKDIEDGYFDACYSGYVIHNFDPVARGQLFKELGRVIKTGGVFVNGDKIVLDDPTLQKEAYEKEVKTFNAFDEIGRPDIREEWTSHYAEDEKVRFAEAEQKKVLEENGFNRVKFVFRELMGCVAVATKE